MTPVMKSSTVISVLMSADPASLLRHLHTSCATFRYNLPRSHRVPTWTLRLGTRRHPLATLISSLGPTRQERHPVIAWSPEDCRRCGGRVERTGQKKSFVAVPEGLVRAPFLIASLPVDVRSQIISLLSSELH